MKEQNRRLRVGTNYLTTYKRAIKIEFNRDISYKHFIELFPQIRAHFKCKGNQLKGKQKDIMKLVKKLGGILSDGIMKFWEFVKEEWNKLYPDEFYKTSRGLRQANLTIQKRLENW